MTHPPPRNVGRRRFLAAAGAATTLSLAGCLDATPLSGQSTLHWTAEHVEMDGRERHHVFGGDDRSLVVTVRQETLAPSDPTRDARIPFFVQVHHRDGLRTERLRFRLLAPARDGSPFPAAVYLRSPRNHSLPPQAVVQDADGWTVVEVNDLGVVTDGSRHAPGDSNVRLDFMLVPTGRHPVAELFVEVDALLGADALLGRRSYRARRMTVFPLVRAEADTTDDLSSY